MTLYEILTCKRDASPEEIKRRYRLLSNIHHPDKNGDEEIFKSLANAYAILSDPEKRARYDAGETAENITEATQNADFEAINMLIQLFNMIVAATDIDKQDIVQLMRLNIKNSLSNLGQAIALEHQKIKRFENVIRRMKSKNPENVFVMSANAQINETRLSITKLEGEVAMGNRALAILEAYSYDFDQVVNIYIGGISFSSVTMGMSSG